MFSITPISRATSPASVSTITSDDSHSTIEDLPSSTRAAINSNNTFDKDFLVPSMSDLIKLDGELNNVSSRDMVTFDNEDGILDQNARSVNVDKGKTVFRDNDLIVDDGVEIHQDDSKLCNNKGDNHNNETVELVRRKYSEIILALKNQLNLYKKFREILPECIRNPVENRVGVIKTDRTKGARDSYQINVRIEIVQEDKNNSLAISSSNQEGILRPKKMMCGYNYFIQEQFKNRDKDSSQKSTDALCEFAKNWQELPDDIKAQYNEKVSRLQESESTEAMEKDDDVILP